MNLRSRSLAERTVAIALSILMLAGSIPQTVWAQRVIEVKAQAGIGLSPAFGLSASPAVSAPSGMGGGELGLDLAPSSLVSARQLAATDGVATAAGGALARTGLVAAGLALAPSASAPAAVLTSAARPTFAPSSPARLASAPAAPAPGLDAVATASLGTLSRSLSASQSPSASPADVTRVSTRFFDRAARMADAGDKGGRSGQPPGGDDGSFKKMPETAPVFIMKEVIFPFPGTQPMPTMTALGNDVVDEAIAKHEGYVVLATRGHGKADVRGHFPLGILARFERRGKEVYVHALAEVRILGTIEAPNKPVKVKIQPRTPDLGSEKWAQKYSADIDHILERMHTGGLLELPDTLLEALSYYSEDHYVRSSLLLNFLDVSAKDKQEFLAISKIEDRLKRIYDHLIEMEADKASDAMARMATEKEKRDAFIDKKIAALNHMRGRSGPGGGRGGSQANGDDEEEVSALKARVEKEITNVEAKETALKELKKIAQMSPQMSEYHVGINYVKVLLDIPWSEQPAAIDYDLVKARSVLDRDHYGMEDVKDVIIEYLAELDHTKDLRHSPILCLVGPPGVGKTSFAQGIAEATGRKLVKVSLGGVRDEAEIRGHRRTYIGSQPGKIISKLRRAKTFKMLMLLDEVDKIGKDAQRGDPSSALLELLDPEQNSQFEDHFVDLPVDMSPVLFMTTANYLDQIPGPLRDRMEIIDLSSYTTAEKIQIAKKHLLPRLLKRMKVDEGQITFTDAAYQKVIENYTGEAGVRNLERRIRTAVRKILVQTKTQKAAFPVSVTPELVRQLLGAEMYSPKDLEPNGHGTATGLAWTSIGGETLTIDVAAYPGKGALHLTGKLGDVMKESASAAMSFIKEHAATYGIDPKVFEQYDFHIHIPRAPRRKMDPPPAP
ncbi:MAG: AAA family ATPase [Elusimicrobia bacterium]|nr:AAA family ATPase [Elusimicrobiota bacterium]